ncbi:MAG TPA: sensor domain-containing diguanylate cyclase [Candidatus Hydrogenedentes bacterium]|nr:sensor domain-containing diguanylate cyclase [Candidatus Hydrogenedentota bacterium]HOL75779.1 sensor domain-containing diguanylate cyclase [Candidatus Hydrogenedentota bacterium]HPO84227.1 sensor domain-containing diguanylate cyclase [Candidatus Hydrogenedentota bacterium]
MERKSSNITFFDDLQTFELLLEETIRFALEHSVSQSVLLMDEQTAKRVREKNQDAAIRIFVKPLKNTGEKTSEFRTKDGASFAQNADRIILFASPHVHILLAAQVLENTFRACWTNDKATVRKTLNCLARDTDSMFDETPKVEQGTAQDYVNLLRMTSALLDHLARKEQNAALEKHDLQGVLEILKAISSKRRCHDVLFVFVEQIAQIMETDRCSVVRIWNGARTGNVLASHDNARLNDLLIDLSKYPEICRALETERTVTIEDAESDPLMESCRNDLRKANIRSILVVPIVLHDINAGSLLLRAARSRGAFTPRDISFCEIVAEAAANAIERAYLFDTIQRANERLEHLAITDDLTGLRNHRAFRETLDREFERARRYRHPLSVILIDIDDFKKVNDTFGHLQGDAVLREMSQRILRMIRKSDVAARYGGEEIVVIMPQTNLEGAYSQACRLLTELSRPPYPGLPTNYVVTASIGLATLDHDRMMDQEALIRTADGALYVAKRNGKNQVVVGQPE